MLTNRKTSQLKSQAQGNVRKSSISGGKSGADKVEFSNEAELKAAINEIRSGNGDWYLL